VAGRWAAGLLPTSAASGHGPAKCTFTEYFLDPVANFVEVDAEDTKRFCVLLIERP
jgi:hypothetical protein